MKLSHDWWFSIQSIADWTLLEDVPFPSAVPCVSNRLLCCLIVGIYPSGISIPLSLLMQLLLGWSRIWLASLTLAFIYQPLVFDINIMVLTKRFHVVVSLFINILQMMSKCGKNISDTFACSSCATSLFIRNFDVTCALLLNKISECHPCVSTLIGYGQQPITARVTFTTLYKK